MKKSYIFKLFNLYIKGLNKWNEYEIGNENNLLVLNLF